MMPPRLLRELYPPKSVYYQRTFPCGWERPFLDYICDCGCEISISTKYYNRVTLKVDLFRQNCCIFENQMYRGPVCPPPRSAFSNPKFIQSGMVVDFYLEVLIYHGVCQECKTVHWSVKPYPNEWNEFLKIRI